MHDSLTVMHGFVGRQADRPRPPHRCLHVSAQASNQSVPDRRPKPQSVTAGHPDKTCATCGRTITWRRKWERDWDNIRFCSDACRTHKPSPQDLELEQTILALLAGRGRDKTICPSEAARAVARAQTPSAPEAPETWQPLMEPARAAARRLVAAGRIVITQGGRIVDPSTAKGPIRLRLR